MFPKSREINIQRPLTSVPQQRPSVMISVSLPPTAPRLTGGSTRWISGAEKEPADPSGSKILRSSQPPAPRRQRQYPIASSGAAGSDPEGAPHTMCARIPASRSEVTATDGWRP